jgi:hypothetical protein
MRAFDDADVIHVEDRVVRTPRLQLSFVTERRLKGLVHAGPN